MTDIVEQTLLHFGPMLSSKLAEVLRERHRVSAPAARQRIARSTQARKLKGLSFVRNARFVYLQQQYGSPDFWLALTAALMQHSAAYGCALSALNARDGIMPLAHFGIACGSPERQKKHLSPKMVLTRLTNAKLIDLVEVPAVGPCVALAQRDGHEQEFAALRARVLTERVLLDAMRAWTRNLGLVSFHKVALRDETQSAPRVGTLAWDLTAPSYLNPLRTLGANRPKAGFVVCDVLLSGRDVSVADLRPFLTKCTTLANLKRVGRTLAFFLTERFTDDALHTAKNAGVVPAAIKSVFGEEAARGLKQLIDVLKDASLDTDPVTIAKIFEGLRGIEGAAINLRGALFQYIAADLLRQNGIEPRHMNRVVERPATADKAGAKAEIDIVATKGHAQVWFVECKGYKPSGVLPDEYVDRWLDHTIAVVRSCALQHPEWKDLKHHFAFWTTARLSQASIGKLEKASTVKKYTISYRDRRGVSELADATNDTALRNTLREHFLEHPMAKIDRLAERGRSGRLKGEALKRASPIDFGEVSLNDSEPPF